MSMGLLAAVPHPLPFNNIVAALPILLLGYSLPEKDGIMGIVSYLAILSSAKDYHHNHTYTPLPLRIASGFWNQLLGTSLVTDDR
jgi:hypothetical protein